MIAQGGCPDYILENHDPKPDLKPAAAAPRDPDQLFNDLFASDDSPGAIARRHNITVRALIDFASSPEIRARLDAFLQLARDRAELIAAEARIAAAHVLHRCVHEGSVSDRARKAATVVFRTSAPRANPPRAARPRALAPPGPTPHHEPPSPSPGAPLPPDPSPPTEAPQAPQRPKAPPKPHKPSTKPRRSAPAARSGDTSRSVRVKSPRNSLHKKDQQRNTTLPPAWPQPRGPMIQSPPHRPRFPPPSISYATPPPGYPTAGYPDPGYPDPGYPAAPRRE